MKKDYFNEIKKLTNEFIPIYLDENYDSANSIFECAICHNRFNLSIHNMIRRLQKEQTKKRICPFCQICTKHVTEEQVEYKFNLVSKSEYKLIRYSGKINHVKSTIQHLSCGHIYDVTLSSFINTGRRCPKCFGTPKYTIKEVNDMIYNIDRQYKLVDKIYPGIDKKIKMKHLLCGNEFDTTLKRFMTGSRCPHCWRELNRSHGESEIRKILLQNNIEFEEQKTFNDLKYKRVLKYDFYVKSLNLCIEYDGAQHFDFQRAFTESYDHFLTQKKCDKIKTEYCKNHNISLLRIKYKLTNKKLATFLNGFLNGNILIKNDNIFYNNFEDDSYFN